MSYPINWVARLDEIFPRDGLPIPTLSARWWQARRGRLTSSSRANTMATRKAKPWNLLIDKLQDEMSDDWQRADEANTAALKWGRANEPRAIATYELESGHSAVEPGMLFHPEFPFVTATPDLLVAEGVRKVVEIKCPHDAKLHLGTLYKPEIAKRLYRHQTQWEAWVAGADAIEFVSYDPRQPMVTQLARVAVPVDLDLQKVFRQNVLAFKELFEAGKRLTVGGLIGFEGPPDGLF